MKLTFKDLKQQKFTLDAEPSETIGDVKAKIAAEKGWEVSSQKLIYSGKILQDDKTIESYNIEEKGFIVYMTQKPKAAPIAQAPPATPAPSTTAQTPAAPQASLTGTNPTDAVPASPSPAPSSVTSSNRAFNDPSALAMGTEERSRAISDMEAMGFPRADIERAMRAAFYNPDRAVEYLLNGIPESAAQSERPTPVTNTANTATTNETTTNTDQAMTDNPVNLFDQAAAERGNATTGTRSGDNRTTTAIGASSLDFLRNNPQFQQLRQVVQQQPQMLEPILQQVVAGNPQVAQMINQNPEQFMQLLAEDVGDDAALPSGVQPISVSEEERDAIERLCRLGFDRELAIQAYFACDKNEELAANFLFEQPDEPDE